jgi:hypothetical protein
MKAVAAEDTAFDLNKMISLEIETDDYRSLYLVLLQTFFFVLTYAVALP